MKSPQFTILIDTREIKPLVFPGYETKIVTLRTGDYSVNGVPVAIERKSVSDLLGCIGQSRERFEKELIRLSQIRYRAIVIEGDMEAVAAGTRFSRLTPKQIISSVLAWSIKYAIPVIFAPNRDWAAASVRTMLSHAVRYSLEFSDEVDSAD